MFDFLSEALSFIGELVAKAVEAMAGVVVFAVYTTLNGVFALFQLILDAAGALLPSLPEITAPPEYVEAINWFFPLVTLLGIAATLLAGYVSWLAVKWVYKKYGAL